MYDLINLQIAEAASGRRKPVFEVAEMTDAHLLLMDLHQPQCGTIYQYPPFVLSLLSRLRILENRRVIFNGLSADPYEIQHIFGKFKMLKKQSKNQSISEIFEKLKLTYLCLVQKKNIRKSQREIDRINSLNSIISCRAGAIHPIFSVYAYSDTYIYIQEEQRFGLSVLNDAEWVITILYKSGGLGDRKIFFKDAFSRMVEIMHKNGKFMSVTAQATE